MNGLFFFTRQNFLAQKIGRVPVDIGYANCPSLLYFLEVSVWIRFMEILELCHFIFKYSSYTNYTICIKTRIIQKFELLSQFSFAKQTTLRCDVTEHIYFFFYQDFLSEVFLKPLYNCLVYRNILPLAENLSLNRSSVSTQLMGR